MESALIVCASEKSTLLLSDMLRAVPYNQIIALSSVQETRRLLAKQAFDLVIINAPLPDESGEQLALEIATGANSQVILIVQSASASQQAAAAEECGVLTLSRPLTKSAFCSVLKLAKAAQNRMKAMQAENTRLVRKMEDIRIVDRAKCILISHMGMSELQAHKYIERQAMDTRTTKRLVAEGILKTYEN